MSNSSSQMKYISQKLLNPEIELSKRFAFQHPHLLKTLDPRIPSTIYFEYSSINLSYLISQRRPNKLFIETDILALLRGISSALAYLQMNNVSHGNIHTSRIFFDETIGVFKIYDEELLVGENHNFIEAKGGRRVFLPPELIRYYRNPQVTNIRGNLYKADVFAFGLAVLEAATLKPSEEIYEIGSLTINANAIEENLMFVMGHYSRELAHVVRLMVEIDEDVRPDALELYSILSATAQKSYILKEIDMESNKENQNVEEPVDLKKSWGPLENLYKSHGLQRVPKNDLKRSFCADDKKNVLVYTKQQNQTGLTKKKLLSNSCILSRSEIMGKTIVPVYLKENKKVLNEIKPKFFY